MFHIRTVNNISHDGLNVFEKDLFNISDAQENPDAILVRSADLHSLEFSPALKAIGRAGAGTNNIPIDRCTKAGIVAFNTPGANANAVKELVLASLFIASRNIYEGIEYTNSLAGKNDHDIHTTVEKDKVKFKGYEIRGKKLGVMGLGAIGMMVANDAVTLGLDVEGYDPFISVNTAWALSRAVKPATNLNKLFSTSDFISVHVPLTDKTRGVINAELLSHVKKGSVLLNFSRSEVVNEQDIVAALDAGHLSRFVTDFPSETLLKHKKVICIPHLGASTKEAENNCSVMVSAQIRDFLINGNITNSVNFPNCSIERTTDIRLILSNENVPNMVGQITSVLASENLNISEMVNKSRGDLAYNIVDLNQRPSQAALEKLKGIPGVLMVRLLENKQGE
ncbi:MAG: phosphoglycerate dehydrogenase [Candidatus Margulisiibacteriota bacterium]